MSRTLLFRYNGTTIEVGESPNSTFRDCLKEFLIVLLRHVDESIEVPGTYRSHERIECDTQVYE